MIFFKFLDNILRGFETKERKRWRDVLRGMLACLFHRLGHSLVNSSIWVWKRQIFFVIKKVLQKNCIILKYIAYFHLYNVKRYDSAMNKFVFAYRQINSTYRILLLHNFMEHVKHVKHVKHNDYFILRRILFIIIVEWRNC